MSPRLPIGVATTNRRPAPESGSPGGFKNDREGLNALRDCLDREAARVVFFFATNRLFRKTYRSLAFVEEQVVDRGLRAVFVRSGVDRTPGGGGTC